MDAAEYYGRLGFDVHNEGSKDVYKPVLEYSLPDNKGKQVVKIEGQITHESETRKITWNLKNINTVFFHSNDPLDVNGHYQTLADGFVLDVKGKMGQHTMLLGASAEGKDFKVEFQNTLNPYINFKINGHSENDDEVSTYHNFKKLNGI